MGLLKKCTFQYYYSINDLIIKIIMMLVITLLIVVNGTVQNGEDEARGLCGVGQSVEITRSGFLIVFN